ncbi:MAG TPA: CBS domain-containing protein [Acidimicrobiia bacterium]|nr:CBS domain-containing protein [Acidimicrobiia bacterium]
MRHDGAPTVRVCDVRLFPVVILHERATLEDAAQAMLRTHAPAVLVGARGAILTEHDIVRAVARADAPRAAVSAFATPDPVTIDPCATALEAIDAMMRHGHRVLLVHDGRESVGFVSLLDACAALLAHRDVPTWLTGLRVALRVEVVD